MATVCDVPRSTPSTKPSILVTLPPFSRTQVPWSCYDPGPSLSRRLQPGEDDGQCALLQRGGPAAAQRTLADRDEQRHHLVGSDLGPGLAAVLGPREQHGHPLVEAGQRAGHLEAGSRSMTERLAA